MRALLVAALLLTASCVEDTGNTVGFETRTLTVTAVDPPKRFKVDVRDSSGNTYSGVARSKRCAQWAARAVVGKTYEVPFEVVLNKDGSVSRHMLQHELNKLLCGS